MTTADSQHLGSGDVKRFMFHRGMVVCLESALVVTFAPLANFCTMIAITLLEDYHLSKAHVRWAPVMDKTATRVEAGACSTEPQLMSTFVDRKKGEGRKIAHKTPLIPHPPCSFFTPQAPLQSAGTTVLVPFPSSRRLYRHYPGRETPLGGHGGGEHRSRYHHRPKQRQLQRGMGTRHSGYQQWRWWREW